MDKTLPNINPSAQVNKITSFIKTVLREQGFQNVVIGVSGGIDSATSFSLLEKSISPQNIYVAHLYYFKSQIDLIKPMLKKAPLRASFADLRSAEGFGKARVATKAEQGFVGQGKEKLEIVFLPSFC
mgnify:CR=1 FL=1